METIKKHSTMIKIDKKYTIKFSYGGVAQYADFRESKGVLINPSLSISWAKANITPDVSKFKTIDKVLKAIKTVAYGGKAEIDTINGYPVFYYKKTKTRSLINKMGLALESFYKDQANIFYETELKPLLVKHKWKISRSHIGFYIVIEKDKNNEWDNVSDKTKEFEFEYLCETFLSEMNIDGSYPISVFFSLLDNFDEFYLDL